MCSSPTASPSTGPRWMNSKAPEYRRVATRVTLADGAQVDAYVYALRD